MTENSHLLYFLFLQTLVKYTMKLAYVSKWLCLFCLRYLVLFSIFIFGCSVPWLAKALLESRVGRRTKKYAAALVVHILTSHFHVRTRLEACR